MKHWLLTLLGFDRQQIPDGAETSFLFTGAPQSWGVFVLVGILALVIYGVVYLYRRELKTAPRSVRIFLAAVRVAVVLLLAIIFLGPSLAISQKRVVQPQILVLLDESQSMAIRDRYNQDEDLQQVVAATGVSADEIRQAQLSRMQLLEKVLQQNNGQLLQDLEQRGKVRVLAYSNKVRAIENRPMSPATLPEKAEGTNETRDSLHATAESSSEITDEALQIPSLEPTGQGTLIGRALREGFKSTSGGRIAAMILIGDGQDTSRQDDPLAAAEIAANQHIPIFTVGIGDPSAPKNLKVVDLFADDQVWQGDPFELRSTIESVGIQQNALEVELLERTVVDGVPVDDSNATDQVIQRQTISVLADGPPQSISFKHTPKQPGQYTYTVRIPPLPEEFTHLDNQKSIPVKVVSEKARVLLIAGGPMWEYRLVQGLLSRDKTVDLSCWLQSMDVSLRQEGDTPIDRMPHQLEDLLQYDLIMLFDPDPSEFNEAWYENLKKFLAEHAGGVLYLAGPKYSSRFLSDPRASVLRDLLPVRLEDGGTSEIEALTARNNQEWPLGIVQSNLNHPIMSFDLDTATNLSRWERMPGVFWSYPVIAGKPATRTLIEHSDPSLRRTEGLRPLLVTGQYGGGRTAFLGFTGTWRWRSVGRDAEFFNKFWIQTVRYLVEGSLLEGKRRGVIETGGDVFRLGDNITVTARLTDAAFQPLTLPTVEAILTAPEVAEARIELKQVHDQPGQYEAAIPAMHLHLNELAITLPADEAGKPVRISKQFTVTLPQVEFDQPRLNRGLLTDIAERSGGRYFQLDQLDQLASAIPDATETVVVPNRPVELWDTSRMLLLLVGLLSLEWAVRKRFKLV